MTCPGTPVGYPSRPVTRGSTYFTFLVGVPEGPHPRDQIRYPPTRPLPLLCSFQWVSSALPSGELILDPSQSLFLLLTRMSRPTLNVSCPVRTFDLVCVPCLPCLCLVSTVYVSTLPFVPCLSRLSLVSLVCVLSLTFVPGRSCLSLVSLV